ncbi:MAG: hypothetical protein ABTD50_03650 [Polyangiaceae bacterium]
MTTPDELLGFMAPLDELPDELPPPRVAASSCPGISVLPLSGGIGCGLSEHANAARTEPPTKPTKT